LLFLRGVLLFINLKVMKKPCLTAVICVFLLFISDGILAQSGQTKLNQVELMKKCIGSWKIELPEGEAMIMEVKPFGSAMVGNTKFISKDTAFDSNKYLWGYDKTNDKIVLAEIFDNTPDIEIDILWFTSESTVDGVLQKDITSPENAVIKFKFEFKSLDLIIFKYLKNNNVLTELTFNREKEVF
jgi:hypothetical protein